MIKSLIRRGTTIGMISTAILGMSWSNLKALALPAEQVVEILNRVPVFALEHDGALVVGSKEGEETKITSVFISHQDANEYISSQVQSQNPDLASQVQVTLVPLGQLYQFAKDNPEENTLKFNLVPNETAVNDAKTVSGEEYQGGVPLFVATGGENNTYLTIEQNSEQVIPLFFDKEQLESRIEEFKTQKPDLAETIKIEVVPLEGMIGKLENEDDPVLSKIVFVPSTETTQFIQQSAPQQPAPAPAPAPEPAPAE